MKSRPFIQTLLRGQTRGRILSYRVWKAGLYKWV